MNQNQQMWWDQIRADHAVLLLLRKVDGSPCHQLHYLQMITEELGKAYLWRRGSPPPKRHIGFVRFIQTLNDQGNVTRVASVLGFKTIRQFENWTRVVAPLAHDLERLSPAMAGDGPNTEYPWPHAAPRFYPAAYSFPIWDELTGTGRGRTFLTVIDVAVREFPKYASN